MDHHGKGMRVQSTAPALFFDLHNAFDSLRTLYKLRLSMLNMGFHAHLVNLLWE